MWAFLVPVEGFACRSYAYGHKLDSRSIVVAQGLKEGDKNGYLSPSPAVRRPESSWPEATNASRALSVDWQRTIKKQEVVIMSRRRKVLFLARDGSLSACRYLRQIRRLSVSVLAMGVIALLLVQANGARRFHGREPLNHPPFEYSPGRGEGVCLAESGAGTGHSRREVDDRGIG